MRILPAIAFFGSESALARAVGKKPGHVYLWKHTRVPAEIAKLIEEAWPGFFPTARASADSDPKNAIAGNMRMKLSVFFMSFVIKRFYKHNCT